MNVQQVHEKIFTITNQNARGMQIKTTVSYNFTPVKLVIRQKKKMLVRIGRKRSSYMLLAMHNSIPQNKRTKKPYHMTQQFRYIQRKPNHYPEHKRHRLNGSIYIKSP
jgi:hypothetical protein